MTQVHTNDADPRAHCRRAAVYLALAYAGAVAAGVAVVTWQRPQVSLAMIAVVYAFVAGLFAIERAAAHLAAATPRTRGRAGR